MISKQFWRFAPCGDPKTNGGNATGCQDRRYASGEPFNYPQFFGKSGGQTDRPIVVQMLILPMFESKGMPRMASHSFRTEPSAWEHGSIRNWRAVSSPMNDWASGLGC